MKLVIVFERRDLEKLQIGVLVEGWERVKRTGSKWRKYKKEFTEKERKYIKSKHALFYRWYLVTGLPETHRMNIRNYKLIQRAVHFFATV